MAVAMAYVFLQYIGASVFILGIMLNFRNTMQGLGKSISPTLCSMLETLMSLAAAFFLIPRWGFTGVCLANPLSWLASGILLYIAFVVFATEQKGRNGSVIPGSPGRSQPKNSTACRTDKKIIVTRISRLN